MTAGFWFSFVAVGTLLCFVTNNSAARDFEVNSQHSIRFLQWFVKPQLIVFLGLAVPLIFWAQQVSLMAPWINMLAIPLVGFVVVPLCLIALLLAYPLPELATGLLQWADYILNLLFGVMEQLVAAGGQWALLQLASLNTEVLLAATLGVLVLLLPVSRTYRYLALPLLLPAKSPMDAPSVWLHVLDVGQGLAVILQTPNHALVYDTGAGEDAETNLGKSVVVPVLRHLGIDRLDALIVSHGDTDHAGGIPGIMAALPVGRRYGSESVAGFQVGAESCLAGHSWTWDGVIFRFLHPTEEPMSANNNSCVLQVRLGEHSIMLPGDIEIPVERALALRYGEALQSDIVLAPHHGSTTSSSYAFIKQLQPAFVVFSAGYRNSFGHPAENVLSRYAEFGADTLSTFHTGMLSFQLLQGARKARVVSFREQYPRYWR